MSHIKEIIKVRETITFLKNKGRNNTSIQDEMGVNFKFYKDIMKKKPENITLRSSSLGKIQDFNKKYAADILSMKRIDGEAVPSKLKSTDIDKPANFGKPSRVRNIVLDDVEPEPKEVEPVGPRHTEKETQNELKDIVEKSRKELLKEYMQKIAVLCEDLPPFLEVTVTIR